MLLVRTMHFTVLFYPSGKLTILRCASNLELIRAIITINEFIHRLDLSSVVVQTSTFVGEYEFSSLNCGGFSQLKNASGLFYDRFHVTHSPETFSQAVSLRSKQYPRLFANLFCSKKLVLMGARNFQELTLLLALISEFFMCTF